MSPTLKQKLAFKTYGGNGGNISKAMREAGYKNKTPMNTEKLTDSVGWKELMEEYLPDSLLAKRHLQLLNKKEVVKEFNHTTGEYDKKVLDQPETQAVSKGLEMAYKLKKRFDDKPITNIQINTFSDLTNEQLEAIRNRANTSGGGTGDKRIGAEKTE